MAPPLTLVEVFRSVQGEGYNQGRDAIFVRFAGCNLSCVFAEGALCDTPYHRNPGTFRWTVDELFAHIASLIPKVTTGSFPERSTMLVLTGGEPTLAPAFGVVVERALKVGFYVAVETNGTTWHTALPDCDWITVSPKDMVMQGSLYEHHNPHPQSPEVDSRMTRWLAHCRELRRHEYRYVISGRQAPQPPYHPPAFRHYLSPAVVSDGSGQEWRTGFPGFVEGSVERCLEIIATDPRWRLSIQAHKILGVR